MGRRTLASLCEEYEVKDYFELLCKVWLTGKKKEALRMVFQMRPKNIKEFMVELNNCTFTGILGDDGPWQPEFLDKIIWELDI